MPARTNILIIDRHERKRFQIGCALDEAGHQVIDFAGSRTVALAALDLIHPDNVDVVMIGDIESGDYRRLAQAELVRQVRSKNFGAAVLGISYNSKPFVEGVTNFPILWPEDAHDLAAHVTALQLKANATE